MTIPEILSTYKLTAPELAKRFNIPPRTMQQWAAGTRTPPDYVILMMEEILHNEQAEA